MLSLKGVRRHYGGREVLRLESFEAAAGEQRRDVDGAVGDVHAEIDHVLAGAVRDEKVHVSAGPFANEPVIVVPGA